MPLYDYKCQKCGETFEVIQKFSDEPLAVHEDCGGALEKQITAAAVHFKGTGWYVTDYAGKKPSNGKSKEESKPAAKSEAATETKAPASTESKPAASA